MMMRIRHWNGCGGIAAHELLPAWIEMQELLSEEEWLKLLGYIWPSCDNISYYKYDIIRALPICPASPRMIVPSLMTSEELAAFDALPDRITIYRGCGPRNKSGLCWTLRREVAEKFPFSRRYQADNPILLTATITKTRVVALKLGRKEDEIIVVGLRKRNWTEERLTSASLDNEAQDESQWAA